MKPRVSDAKQAERFFIDVLWNWTAVGANIFTGIFLTPYLIKKLGVQRWGTWTIVFALIEYIFLFDLGFRSAIVNFVSRYRVVDDFEGVNGVINTALAYFLGVAGIVVILTLGLASHGYHYFKVAPEDQNDFTFLLIIVGFTWAIGVISNIFQASLEAFQQFKTYNHIFIVMLVLRAGGCALILFLGHGLRGLGLCVMAAQFFGYAAMFVTFRRAFPELRIAPPVCEFPALEANGSLWRELGNCVFRFALPEPGAAAVNWPSSSRGVCRVLYISLPLVELRGGDDYPHRVCYCSQNC